MSDKLGGLLIVSYEETENGKGEKFIQKTRCIVFVKKKIL